MGPQADGKAPVEYAKPEMGPKRAALAELLCARRPEPELHKHRIMAGTLMVSRGGMEGVDQARGRAEQDVAQRSL